MNAAEARAAVDTAIAKVVTHALHAGRTADSVELFHLDRAEGALDIAINEMVEAVRHEAQERAA